MWTSTLELSPSRVIPTHLLGLFWRGAYFSSFAPLQIQNLPRSPLPSTSWVRVRNRLAGICGSDLHQVYGDGDFRISPAALPRHIHTYPGHEVVGEVIEVGEEVQQLGVGDRVILQHAPNCLTAGTQPLCRSCAVGNYNLCENGAIPDPQQIGGGWSEEMLLHEQQLFLAPTGMSDEQAVMLEPTAVALRAVLHSFPQAGDRVLIIGSGTIGLLILNIVRALAPDTEVSILAKHAFQVEQATRMGAAHIVYPQDSYTSIQRATGARLYRGMLGNQTMLGGYDIIYDTVGNTKTVHDALRWARAQANVVMVGLNLHLMRVDLSPIWSQEVNLIGTTGHGMENWPIGTREWRSTFDIASELILHGLIHPERLVTHRFALNDYREALTTAMDKNNTGSIKVAFDYALQPASVVPNVRAAARPRRPLTGTPPRSTAGLLSGPLTPMPAEPHPVKEPEPVAQQPRLNTGTRANRPPMEMPDLIVPEDGEVTAKAPVPTSEQLAIRKDKSKSGNEVASAPVEVDEQAHDDESTLRFKRPSLPSRPMPAIPPAPEPETRETSTPDEEQETQSFARISRVAPEKQPETPHEPAAQKEPETVQDEESEQDVVTVRQSKPISLPAQFRQETAPQGPEAAITQEPVEHVEPLESSRPVKNVESSEISEPIQNVEPLETAESAETAKPVNTATPVEARAFTPEPVEEQITPETSNSEAEQEAPSMVTTPASEPVAESEQEAVPAASEDSLADAETSPGFTIPAGEKARAESEAQAIAADEADTAQPEVHVAEVGSIPTPPSLRDQIANSETVHVPTPTQEQLAAANAETTPTPATHTEHISDIDTLASIEASTEAEHFSDMKTLAWVETPVKEDESPERYEFAGPMSNVQDAETLPELTYEPENLYYPDSDFGLSEDDLRNAGRSHANPDNSEMNIDFQQIAHSSEALPEPEAYETTIFDIPPDEQLNWLSSMQSTEKDEAVDPGAPPINEEDSSEQAQRKTQASRSNKSRKRRH